MKDLIDLAAYPAQQFEQAPSAERTRALVFLTGNEKLIQRLERYDDRTRHHAVLLSSTWTGIHLRVELSLELYLSGRLGRRQPVLFEAADGRVSRTLPDDILRLVSTGAVGSLRNVTDVTAELPRTQTFLLLRRRETGDTIRIQGVVDVESMKPAGPPESGYVTPRFMASMVLTWQEAQALVSRRWERYSVVDTCGFRTVHRLPTLTRRTLGKPSPGRATLALSASAAPIVAES